MNFIEAWKLARPGDRLGFENDVSTYPYYIMKWGTLIDCIKKEMGDDDFHLLREDWYVDYIPHTLADRLTELERLLINWKIRADSEEDKERVIYGICIQEVKNILYRKADRDKVLKGEE